MTLIKSISGIRGTIGGRIGDSLTSVDVLNFTYAYAQFIKSKSPDSITIVVGRDARKSGDMISRIVTGTLMSCGFNVLDVGLSTTPTIEMAVISSNSAGGIIITASHNPKNWNALKLLNSDGEFLSDLDGNRILKIAEEKDFLFSELNQLGEYNFDDTYNDKHIDQVLNLSLVDSDLVRSSKFKVVLDAVNSTGGFMVPKLLKKMGVECIELYCDPNGDFPHDPEPLAENLKDLSNLVVKEDADFGIVVDPDVDRLAFVCEDGTMFGEEYTLVAVSDFILSRKSGNTVSNLSSTSALLEVTKQYGGNYVASAVGEVNVVSKMKETDAIIGGEGNGGIIYPELHYGRDALVGIALFLTYLASSKLSISNLRKKYPDYHISKNKIELTKNININDILSKLHKKYIKENISTIDGLKIIFGKEWVHLRRSNTEPIIRIYAESINREKADSLANKMIVEIKDLIR